MRRSSSEPEFEHLEAEAERMLTCHGIPVCKIEQCSGGIVRYTRGREILFIAVGVRAMTAWIEPGDEGPLVIWAERGFPIERSHRAVRYTVVVGREADCADLLAPPTKAKPDV